ncbi:MAG: hypothetical protein CL441_05955 [Acidimicrobiaceae bacterium]|nr:hypothetical protein [Acidimicrobiaceae bacterium]|tara:strand:+ start:245 stop:463 length:219 start_codon:yes stop_codon:yes gene_type:complete
MTPDPATPAPSPSDADLSSVTGQIDALLTWVEQLVGTLDSADRTGDEAGLLEVERHLRGARRELERVRRRRR